MTKAEQDLSQLLQEGFEALNHVANWMSRPRPAKARCHSAPTSPPPIS